LSDELEEIVLVFPAVLSREGEVGTEGVAGGGGGVGAAAATFLCKNKPKKTAEIPPKKVRRSD
jgi:hypothetical protein